MTAAPVPPDPGAPGSPPRAAPSPQGTASGRSIASVLPPPAVRSPLPTADDVRSALRRDRLREDLVRRHAGIDEPRLWSRGRVLFHGLLWALPAFPVLGLLLQPDATSRGWLGAIWTVAGIGALIVEDRIAFRTPFEVLRAPSHGAVLVARWLRRAPWFLWCGLCLVLARVLRQDALGVRVSDTGEWLARAATLLAPLTVLTVRVGWLARKGAAPRTPVRPWLQILSAVLAVAAMAPWCAAGGAVHRVKAVFYVLVFLLPSGTFATALRAPSTALLWGTQAGIVFAAVSASLATGTVPTEWVPSGSAERVRMLETTLLALHAAILLGSVLSIPLQLAAVTRLRPATEEKERDDGEADEEPPAASPGNAAASAERTPLDRWGRSSGSPAAIALRRELLSLRGTYLDGLASPSGNARQRLASRFLVLFLAWPLATAWRLRALAAFPIVLLAQEGRTRTLVAGSLLGLVAPSLSTGVAGRAAWLRGLSLRENERFSLLSRVALGVPLVAAAFLAVAVPWGRADGPPGEFGAAARLGTAWALTGTFLLSSGWAGVVPRRVRTCTTAMALFLALPAAFVLIPGPEHPSVVALSVGASVLGVGGILARLRVPESVHLERMRAEEAERGAPGE